MPPLIVVVAAGVAAYAGYRWLAKQIASPDDAAARVGAKAAAGAASVLQAKDLGTLEWDEAAGAYRPKSMN
ncbi:MAG: hypothetical protein SH859_09810 [Hyphomicrobium aestuarii]|nr:hypothetical protein [Hyphomicrobium aestuarii]